MDVSIPPSLDLACPQAKADIEKYLHMFRDTLVEKGSNVKHISAGMNLSRH